MRSVEIINKIIELEESAQKMVSEAKDEHEALSGKVSQILETKKHEYKQKSDQQIAQSRKEEEREANLQIAKLNSEHSGKLEKLRRLTDENLVSWSEKIYKFITSPASAK